MKKIILPAVLFLSFFSTALYFGVSNYNSYENLNYYGVNSTNPNEIDSIINKNSDTLKQISFAIENSQYLIPGNPDSKFLEKFAVVAKNYSSPSFRINYSYKDLTGLKNGNGFPYLEFSIYGRGSFEDIVKLITFIENDRYLKSIELVRINLNSFYEGELLLNYGINGRIIYNPGAPIVEYTKIPELEFSKIKPEISNFMIPPGTKFEYAPAMANLDPYLITLKKIEKNGGVFSAADGTEFTLYPGDAIQNGYVISVDSDSNLVKVVVIKLDGIQHVTFSPNTRVIN